MPRIIFARHGESTANLSRTFANRDEAHSLTPVGVAQAERLAGELAGRSVRRLFTSPITRALETADIVARRLNIVPQATEALREFDVGRWEGASDEEGWAEYQRVHGAWLAGDEEAAVGGGESLADIRLRTQQFFDELVRLEGTTVCISHGGLYRTALPGRLANVTKEFAFTRDFPNVAWVEAEAHDGRLWCVEWCGEALR